MKKWGFLKMAACSLPAIMLSVTSGCSEEDYDFIPGPWNVTGKNVITVTPSGGDFQAIGGNVKLNFPAGAVTQSKALSVSILVSKPLEENAFVEVDPDFVLKAILIEPFMVFDKPVQVTLKCDGCLRNGVSLQEGMNLLAFLWENETCFFKSEVPCICTSCQLNPGQGTISMCICQSGVVAVQKE